MMLWGAEPSTLSLALLASVLSASLLGSLHCAGMCGPFVAVYSAATRKQESGSISKIWPLHAAYHAGRVLTYAGVGALAGSLGSFVDWAGEIAGIAQMAAAVSSLLLIFWGLGILFPRLRIRSPWDGALGRGLVLLRRKPQMVQASLLGIFTPLLPCGWFYAFALTAAGTAHALSGALVMTVFWLGTVPALLGVGTVMNRVGGTLRRKIPVLTGSLLILIGIFGVFNRMQHPLKLSTGSGVTQQTQVKCH